MNRQYPVGIQDFRKIRESGKIYVDKTEYVWRMAHSDSDYYFLARPRRFGKSLLVSTLQYYFEGRKDLFEGLAIDKLETEWDVYPVLRFDMSKSKNLDLELLNDSIGLQIAQYEDIYGNDPREKTLGDRLGGVIKRAYKKTGHGAVLLVDEYDAPMLDVAHDTERMEEVRRLMSNFYSNLKGSGEFLRFVFLTGITKFSQMGIFSGVNNLVKITTRKDYAAVCGITKKELVEQMAPDIEMFAKNMELTEQEALDLLIENYDGYHFTWPSEDILNPFSLLNAFSEGEIRDYWFETGTSASSLELLRKYGVTPMTARHMEVTETDFNVPIEASYNSIPLLYQSGYLTIKDYNRRRQVYTLDIPNKEVRTGLMKTLLPHYLHKDLEPGMGVKTNDMRLALEDNDIETAMKYMGEILQMIPYTNDSTTEGHFQRLMYCFFTMAGAECQLEQHTAAGRADIVVRTRNRIYVIELKMDKSAEEAMAQINNNDYASYFAGCTLPVTKVGVNIDSKTRTINQVIFSE